MICINNLSKKYDDKQVLNIENLIIEKGERFGLVGNNGAVKTTLFNLILDLVKPNTGDIYNKDIPVSESELWKKHTSAFID
jgi:ABC-2 type transport system ATP-binding protein